MNPYFEQLAKDAESKKYQLGVAAIVAADAARFMIGQIDAARPIKSDLFKVAIEPYWQRFHLFSDLDNKFERRLVKRRELCKYESEDTINHKNLAVFTKIVESFGSVSGRVSENPLAGKSEKEVESLRSPLHQALHLTELAAAFSHTHPVVHIIGPVVGLILGAFEKHYVPSVRNPFAEAAQFFDSLKEIDSHLMTIAVGVYRVPLTWERGKKGFEPRLVGDAEAEFCSSLSSVLPQQLDTSRSL